MTTTISLANLPGELYAAILSHVPHEALQSCTLNLTRAIPLSPVPIRPLFEHITISRGEQLPQLYRRFRYYHEPVRGSTNPAGEEPLWVKSFNLSTWKVDAEVVVNVLALLSSVERLNLKIGPVFAPEHLQDMFTKPLDSLKWINVRFRPYVQTATYYQFLKGSYFDSMLAVLSDWPEGSLSHLSIIQDPLRPLEGKDVKKFAQPIVFFSLDPLTTLSKCPAMHGVTHVRIRVPFRQLARYVASSSPSGKVEYPFPRAEMLDLSTSVLRDLADLEAVLNNLGRGSLQHLLLDNTGLCDGSSGEWEALGRTCALAGVKRAREREKLLKAWSEPPRPDGDGANGAIPPHVQGVRPRRGRRGLASATISLRERPDGALPNPPGPPAGQGVSMLKAAKIRIVPSPPQLKSLCATMPRPLGPAPEDQSQHEADARFEFAKGWMEGFGQIRSIWTRLQQSQSNGVRVFRFGRNNEEISEEEGVLAGLIEVALPRQDSFWDELVSVETPVLCFAGAREEELIGSVYDWTNHVEGCGHRIAWDAWEDNL
ncbi:hypothetical protein BU17DRAFT_77768 [Hysterangium stoloniferum]|nr:hypothetical protein BU17DRAFT_77768 [Hysterangium stoloniferum]